MGRNKARQEQVVKSSDSSVITCLQSPSASIMHNHGRAGGQRKIKYLMSSVAMFPSNLSRYPMAECYRNLYTSSPGEYIAQRGLHAWENYSNEVALPIMETMAGIKFSGPTRPCYSISNVRACSIKFRPRMRIPVLTQLKITWFKYKSVSNPGWN